MATITIDPARRIGSVDPRIFGGFIEHLGRCIYGGVFGEGSPLSNAQGYRLDVVEAVKALRLPVLRWPGGNFVSGYHWIDGTGPVDQRPRRIELAWHGEESNRFGTDEFIGYCRLIGAEPYICVNMGSGSMDEAQAWVEYCNGTANTHWANLRRRNGHPEPYSVKYWGLGNEMYGRWQIGALSADDYVKKARDFAKVMKRTDPTIQLVACGENGWSDWDCTVIEGLASLVDFHSIHIYTGSDDYYSNVFAPHQADRALGICRALIDRVRYIQRIDHPVHVAYDEWNVWFRARGAETALEERYTLADALAVATYLNVFLRHCQTVRIANLAQLVNVIAPIFTNEQGLFLQTIYHPLRLFAECHHPGALDVHVDGPTYTLDPAHERTRSPYGVADLSPFQLLVVAATCDSTAQHVTISVVNRHHEQPITAHLRFVGFVPTDGSFCEVNGPSVETINSFATPDAVAVREGAVHLGDAGERYSFPAHSITVLRLDIA